MTATFALTTLRETLLGAVETALAPVERKNTIPVLANLLLDGGDSGLLRVSGTDLDVMTSVATAIAVDAMPDEGETLPAALLHDILRKLPAKAEVSLKSTGKGQMAITSGRSRFTLQTLPGADWPRLVEKEPPAARFAIPATQFAAMLAAVKFAISTEETRYYLNGVFMHCLDGRLITVATDGHRLARAVTAAPEGAPAMPGVIIPRKTVDLVAKALAGAGKEAKLAISVSENRICFELGAVQIASKLIDGTFPDYQRVIPTGNDRMAWGQATADLAVINPEAGDGQDSVDVEAAAGEDVEIGFNSKYLGEMLTNIAASGQTTAAVALAGPGAPARFAPVGDENDEIEMTFVLMPMRV